jgi:predicted dehydrogenase
MTAVARLHLCVLGCGWAARQHARVLAPQSARVDLSFASRTMAKAESFRREHGGRKAFGSYDEAIGSADVDAVLICTPHDQHHAQACHALHARKHVVVEKPIAISVEQAREMNRLALEQGRHLLVAENFRFRPSVRELETMIASGTVGAPKMIRIQVFQKRGMHRGEWRADETAMGGGPFVDGGIHWVNTLLTLGGGSAENVFGRTGRHAARDWPREDTTVVLCDLANGAIGSLGYSWAIAGVPRQKLFAVYGTEGSIYVSSFGRYALISGKRRGFRIFPWRDWNGYHAMWESFLRTLIDGEQGIMTGLEGERDLRFVEAVYASAFSGQVAPMRSEL